MWTSIYRPFPSGRPAGEDRARIHLLRPLFYDGGIQKSRVDTVSIKSTLLYGRYILKQISNFVRGLI